MADIMERKLNEETLPKDHYNVVYWIIFLVGVICMLPWDMMVTVNGYWHYKFRNVSFDSLYHLDDDDVNNDILMADNLSKRQKEFESYIAIAASVPSAATVVTHAFVGNRFGVHGRAVMSLVGIILTFTGIILLAYLDSDDWETPFLISNLTLAVVINIFRALFRATNSANMGKFPVAYMGSLANGICMGGLIPVLVNILILSLDVDIQMAGFSCFVFSGSLAVLCLVLFLCMEKTEFYVHYTNLECQASQDKDGRPSQPETVLSRRLLWQVLHSSWMYILIIFIQTTTTAVVYPAVTSLVRPHRPTLSEWHQIYFTQVSCFLVFNICNILGTALAGWIQWPSGTSMNSQVTLLLASCLRVTFIPIFMMCNLAPMDRKTEVLLPHDPVFVCLMALFSLTDGYVGNMAMMFGPKSGSVDQHQEITAGILVACITTSLSVGAVLSNVVVKML